MRVTEGGANGPSVSPLAAASFDIVIQSCLCAAKSCDVVLFSGVFAGKSWENVPHRGKSCD